VVSNGILEKGGGGFWDFSIIDNDEEIAYLERLL
jgi:hypothetical protein